ncbi:MAG: hypothetical protein ACYDG4_10860 [Desulfuromonadaceae bacterium]
MNLPPGPWTAEVMHQVVEAKVAEIRQGLKERRRRVNTLKVNDDAVRLIMKDKFYRWDQDRCVENLIIAICGLTVIVTALIIVWLW